jgi:peroxiredoxin
MQWVNFTVAIVVCSFCSGLFAAADPANVPDFALLDQRGKHHQLSYYGDQDAVVIVTQRNGDAAVRDAQKNLAAIRAKFESGDVVFFMLNAEDDRASITEEADRAGYDLPILVDDSQLVAESLGLQNSAEAVVINPQTMTLVYRGAVGDPLAAALSGESMGISGNGSGTPLKFANRGQQRESGISYSRDIVPILQDNCVSCHHDGGIGPWSMSSHAMVQGWSKMMREVVMTRRMPPGQIDTHVGRPIQETAGLTVAEQQTLVHWIDAGAPGDDAGDPLAALDFSNPRYTLGEPDIVLKVPAQSIPATGVIDYRYVPVELNLDRDIWIRAMETVPGDRQVLHHVIAYVSSPADKTVRGRQTGAANGESLGGFAPGRQPDVFRDNSGRLVRKGSNLLLQMHYTTSGKATVDETEIGLFLYDEPPAHVMAGGVAGQRRFLIPPHAKEHKLEGEQLIERDAYLYSLMPHMHYRGKYMSYTAEYPDGRSEVLLSVPRYEFNWQFNYQLEEPVFLPAGTRLIARGAMDNSDRNPFNPDPSRPVHFGLQTKHEMFFGFTTLRYVGDTPEQRVANR